MKYMPLEDLSHCWVCMVLYRQNSIHHAEISTLHKLGLNLDPFKCGPCHPHLCGNSSHSGPCIILATGSARYEGIFWLSYFCLFVMGMYEWVQNSSNGSLTDVRPICQKMTSLWSVRLQFVIQLCGQGQKLYLPFVHSFYMLVTQLFRSEYFATASSYWSQ